MRQTVQRGAGDVPAPDELTAELACSEAPATQAGRNYLDANGQDMTETTLTCLPPDALAILPGDLLEVDDTTAGETWRGKATAFTLTLAVDDAGAATVTREYTVERPL
jgi:hypothetical protein